MKRPWFPALLITLVLIGGSGRALAGHSALAAAEVVGVTAGTARYALFIPGNWNGGLVVYAHGYVDPDAPLALPDVSPAIAFLRETLLGFGFGVAYSSYSTNGYAVKDGAQRTHELRGLFAASFGPPRRTYVIGHSLGGIITLMLAERYPGQYDGALPMCGPVGGGLPQVDYIANVRVLFDFFFPGVIPGDALHVPEGLDLSSGSPLLAAIIGAIVTNPAAALALASVDQVELPFTTPDELVASIVRVLFYNIRGANDLLGRTHDHSPFDNTAAVYSGLGPVLDAAVNAGVDRFTSTPDAVNYVERYYQPTGRLRTPVVTLHTTLDPEVPFFHEALLAAVVADAGGSELLVQQHVNRYGHCGLTVAEMVNAFSGLVSWVETGVKPPSGDVTTP